MHFRFNPTTNTTEATFLDLPFRYDMDAMTTMSYDMSLTIMNKVART
jgi:hypothetical protein